MAKPDPGPLLDEQLDEFELIIVAGEKGGVFDNDTAKKLGISNEFDALNYVVGWHDQHDRKLLEAARWALANGWKRGAT